jgi:HEAT repeat protein
MVIPDNEEDADEAGPVQEPDTYGTVSEDRLSYFIRMLSDDEEINRLKAAESLGRMGHTGAVKALIDTLWDDDPRVRLKAAWALGRIGDSQALPPLRRLYRMEKEDVKDIIIEAIDEINFRMNRK